MFNTVTIAIFISFLWGLMPVIHKFMLSNVNYHPYTLMAIGSLAYFSVLCIFVYVNQGTIVPDVKRMNWKHIVVLSLTSIIGGFWANLLYYQVLKRNSQSYIATTLMFSSPIFTFFLAVWFLKEKVEFHTFAGVVLTVAGITLLAFHSKDEFKNQDNLLATV